MTPAAAKSVPSAVLCEMLLRQSPGCTWLLRPDLVFHSIYGDAQRVFGRAAPQLEGTNFSDLFEPPLRLSWIRRVDRVFIGQTVSAAARFGQDALAYSITLFPVQPPQERIAFAGGIAHTMAQHDLILRTLQALETDRARFYRLLHDHVGQYLSAAGLQLDLLRMDLADSAFPIAGRTAEIQATLDTVMGLVRDLNHELNPAVAERMGLRAALDRLAGRLRTDFKGNVRLLADATAQPSPEAAAALYRIAQEAAGNAVRHAGCSLIELLLKSLRNGIALEIRDNGHGFEVPEGLDGTGLGLLAMRYHADRAGIELEIQSAPGSGTVVRALCRSTGKSD